MFSVRRIMVRGLAADSEVFALCLGDWAVHRQIDTPALYGLTLMPIGLSLPFCWASFKGRRPTLGAMREIARMRNSWAVVTQTDFTRALGDRLKAICVRHGAIKGPVQVQWDADKSLFGLPVARRLNGYALPALMR